MRSWDAKCRENRKKKRSMSRIRLSSNSKSNKSSKTSSAARHHPNLLKRWLFKNCSRSITVKSNQWIPNNTSIKQPHLWTLSHPNWKREDKKLWAKRLPNRRKKNQWVKLKIKQLKLSQVNKKQLNKKQVSNNNKLKVSNKRPSKPHKRK